MSVTSFVDRMQ